MRTEKQEIFGFPKELSPKDIELILAQCEKQGATDKEGALGFAAAYLEAKNCAEDDEWLKNLKTENISAFIMHLAELVGKSNQNGFRKVPVHFADYSKALNPKLIERAMENFSRAYAEGSLPPEKTYAEFEKIHPFLDGNGRVGDLLWKIAVKRETGKWPEELPPDPFEQNKKI